MRPIVLICLLFFASCQSATTANPSGSNSATPLSTTDTMIKVLWRDNVFDTALNDTFNTIVVNEKFCRNAPDHIKAAIGYVGTFIGSDCNWDGAANDSMSNLSCKLISALGLGYQCSENHINFLKHWFRNEGGLLKELENCPVAPFTASAQNTFEKMDLLIKNDTLTVIYEAAGVNMKINKSWTWNGKFKVLKGEGEVRLITREESKPEYTELGD